MNGTGRRIGLSVVVVLAGIGLGVGVFSLRHQSTPPRGHVVSELEAFQSMPLGPDGRQVSLDQLQSQASFDVLRPQQKLASDSTAAAVWVRGGDSPEVLIDYESGVRLIARPSALTPDPRSFYQQMITEGAKGSLQTLNGTVAFVIPPDPASGAPGSVDFVTSGIEISIIGHGTFSTDDLVRVASTVS